MINGQRRKLLNIKFLVALNLTLNCFFRSFLFFFFLYIFQEKLNSCFFFPLREYSLSTNAVEDFLVCKRRLYRKVHALQWLSIVELKSAKAHTLLLETNFIYQKNASNTEYNLFYSNSLAKIAVAPFELSDCLAVFFFLKTIEKWFSVLK